MRMSCVRPGCGGSATAVVLWDRDALLVTIDEPEAAGPGAIVLCARHIGRFKAPVGWKLDDLRPGHEAPPAPAATPPPAAPELANEEGAMAPPSLASSQNETKDETHLRADATLTPMIERAFRSASPGQARRPGAEIRGFAWLERVHPEIDSGPERLGERVEHHRQEPADGERDDQEGHSRDLGGGRDEPDDERDEHHAEGDDGVHADRPDELPFAALEQVAAARAALDDAGVPREDVTRAADATPQQEGTAEHAAKARGRGGRNALAAISQRITHHAEQGSEQYCLFPAWALTA
jgi:hypothetical protein